MSLSRAHGKIAARSLAASRSAWWATSFNVARSTARRVSTAPIASIRPTESTTTSTVATNRFVRSERRRPVSRVRAGGDVASGVTVVRSCIRLRERCGSARAGRACGGAARRERLRQVIVGAKLEPGDSVGLLVARGEHEDWHVRASPHQPGDVEPVDAGQADVEDDDPDLVPAELGQRLFSGADPDDAPAAALEIPASHGADRMLVLDEQDRALLAPVGDGLGVHLPVAKTWSAGLSPSRNVVAIMPVRSWKKLAFLPLSLTRTFGEMLIVTSDPSGSLNRSVKTPTSLMRPWSSR